MIFSMKIQKRKIRTKTDTSYSPKPKVLSITGEKRKTEIIIINKRFLDMIRSPKHAESGKIVEVKNSWKK